MADTTTRAQAVPPAAPARSVRPPRRFDRLGPVAGLIGYLLLALYLTAGLWAHGADRAFPGISGQDGEVLEWSLANAAHAVSHLADPLFTNQLNVPMGVNEMANVSMLGVGVPLAPVTLLFGARTTFVLLAVACLAGTAAVWYLVFARYLVRSRLAAFAGGALAGFAPPMLWDSYGHQHIVAQFLVPVLVLRVLALREPGRAVRNGLLLGLLIAYQALIGEEVLLVAALAIAVFVVAMVLRQPALLRHAADFGRGLAVAAGTAVVLLGYPLWMQFFGPQHYRALPFDPLRYGTDLALFTGVPTNYAYGNTNAAVPLVHHWVSSGAWFGWPLLAVLAVAAWLGRRSVVMVGALAVAVVFGWLSLGARVYLGAAPVPVLAPWRWLGHLPLLDTILTPRLIFAVVPALAAVLAIGCDRVRVGVPRVVLLSALAVAVLAVLPAPLTTEPVRPVPRFVTAGLWRDYVPGDRTLVPVPLPASYAMDGMRWATAARADFALPRGYFIGPGADGPEAMFGAPARWTSALLDDVAATGVVPTASPAGLDRLIADLRYWRAAVLVLAPGQPNAVALRAALAQYLGPPRHVADVWLWDVRPLTVGS